MSVLSCCKGGVFLFQGLLLLGFFGCSSAFRGQDPHQGEIPMTNMQVAEKVIELALENAAIPYGHGAEATYKEDGDSKENNLSGMIALEFLLKHGYKIVVSSPDQVRGQIKDNDSFIASQGGGNELPEIRIRLDTLYVNLHIQRTKK